MSITRDTKQNLISKFAINKNDTGSAEVQIAVLSERIKNLTEHFKSHKHDNHSKNGLIAINFFIKDFFLKLISFMVVKKYFQTFFF